MRSADGGFRNVRKRRDGWWKRKFKNVVLRKEGKRGEAKLRMSIRTEGEKINVAPMLSTDGSKIANVHKDGRRKNQCCPHVEHGWNLTLSCHVPIRTQMQKMRNSGVGEIIWHRETTRPSAKRQIS